jgi:phosphate transport system substrate-binding protein
VRRSDGSGTTYYFTHYLSKVSADWRSRVGTNTAVEWPTGMAARGNEGIANTVALTKGSIGYAEYAYARHNQLIFTRLVNKDAKAVAPGTASFMAAASNANWEGTPGFGVILTDSSGADSWPIASATFILMHKQPDDPAAAREALKFFAWAFASGAKLAEELLYVPMPGNVVGAIQRLWATEIKDASGKPLLTTSN